VLHGLCSLLLQDLSRPLIARKRPAGEIHIRTHSVVHYSAKFTAMERMSGRIAAQAAVGLGEEAIELHRRS
jgi:hypothetical protein